jgi:uncharacterized membrane protein
MNLVPEWAPNVHPLVVHFPIALLFAAVLVDAAALVVQRRFPGVRYAAVGLYALGAVAAVVTFLTGRAAADGLDLPTTAIAAVGEHADWALWTVWAFGFYGLVRLGTAFWEKGGRLVVHLPLFLLGAAGLVLVQQTAERGARLVYDLGVGVRAVETAEADPFAEAQPDDPGGDHAGMTEGEMAGVDGADAPTLQTTAEGAWRWEAEAGALPRGLRFLDGEPSDLAVEAPVEAASAEAGDDGVVLRPRHTVLFTAGEPVEGVEVQAELDLSGFTGRAALVHHVQDARNYDFLAVEKRASGGTVRQGRVRGGAVETFDEKTFDADAFEGGPITLRSVAYGTHFRGYLGGELAAHGHGDAATAGRSGLLLDGSGPLRLLRLEAVPVTD